MNVKSLLSVGTNAKTIKSDKGGVYRTAIMYLAPHKSGGRNVCASASPGCISSCLFTAGRGAFNSVQNARNNRTKLWFEDRNSFIVMLTAELVRFEEQCKRDKVRPCVRLNGTSDIMWEKEIPGIFGTFKKIQFYDYTKHYKRYCNWLGGNLPENYHLTWSRSETNHDRTKVILRMGGTAAVVFGKELPNEWCGYPVFNMDNTDLRFLDPAGVGGLVAKGKARKDKTGFVVRDA